MDSSNTEQLHQQSNPYNPKTHKDFFLVVLAGITQNEAEFPIESGSSRGFFIMLFSESFFVPASTASSLFFRVKIFFNSYPECLFL